MNKLLLASLFVATLSTPIMADEFTDTVALVLEAYSDGDIAGAKDELDYAVTLLQTMQGDGFKMLLPDALDGWTKEIDPEADAGMAIMGGGTMAKADYSNGSDDLSVTLMTGGPLVSSMATMLGNTQTMAMMGKVVRIKRKSFLNQDDNLQGMIGNVMIQVEGSASVEDKIAYIKALDFDALKAN